MHSMKSTFVIFIFCMLFLAIGVLGVGAYTYSGNYLKAMIFVPAISYGLLATFLSWPKNILKRVGAGAELTHVAGIRRPTRSISKRRSSAGSEDFAWVSQNQQAGSIRCRGPTHLH